MSLSPELLASLTTGQKRHLLSDADFIEDCLNEGVSPASAVGLDGVPLTRISECVAPVALDRINPETGEVSELLLPCGSANSLKCPSCAEFQARLRQRQIMNGLTAPSTRVAFFTNTAPSFGKVHRASYTQKDEFKARHLSGAKREANRLTVMKRKGRCGCGSFHDWLDPRIGVPLDPQTYKYASEVIWSENLPNLMKSLTRKLRTLAEAHGIRSRNEYANGSLVAPSQLSLYTVYERQKRGSLHAHTLIVVDDAEAEFESFFADLKTNWKGKHNPTASIPEHRERFYHSEDAQRRWSRFFPFGHTLNPDEVIPQVKWKGGHLRAGTEFGTVWDIRELAPEQDETGEISGHQQAAAYLAKYLTKNQSALSPAAIASQKSLVMRSHLTAMRQATLALTGDRIVVEALLANVLGEIASVKEELAPLELASLALSEYASPRQVREVERPLHYARQDLAYLQDLADVLVDAKDNLRRHPLIDELFSEGKALSVTAVSVSEAVPRTRPLVSSAVDGRIIKASRGLAIRLNKVLDNGGFTGSLTSISNWNTSLKDLKEEMKAYATGGVEDVTEFEYALNPARMRELAIDRRVRPIYTPQKKERPGPIINRVLGTVPSG